MISLALHLICGVLLLVLALGWWTREPRETWSERELRRLYEREYDDGN